MRLKYISWIPAFIAMIVIFMFSAKPAAQSNNSSVIIAEQVIKCYENITNKEFDTNVRDDLIDRLNHIVRKSAHFLEYALLAWCIGLHLAVIKLEKRLFFNAVLLSAVYAVTDEIHQYFVPGRSCQITDVLLDSCGAAVGAFIFILMRIIYKKVKATVLARNG